MKETAGLSCSLILLQQEEGISQKSALAFKRGSFLELPICYNIGRLKRRQKTSVPPIGGARRMERSMTSDPNSQIPYDELTPRLYQTLADTFGFRSFRPYQEEIVRAILNGQDVFAVMPTGGGKSLCYQLPAALAQGMCVVVSPLLSLMKDQVDAALKNGINAATLNSTTPSLESREIAEQIDAGRLDLLYVSPERFNNDRFRESLRQTYVSFFAIDEAHCISQWGHNFRADYLELGKIVDEFDCPVAAFTATATELVGNDIIRSLKLRDPFCVKASFDRPNLFYQIGYKDNFERQLLDFLKEVPGESGIVYRSTRRNVEKTAKSLVAHGYKAEPYHAGMSDEDRAAVQDRFAKDETPIIVATIAFGMGIDKSNVRFVVHGDLPKDVESYYQETGRAGRDGAPARCLLLFGYNDVAIHRSFLKDYDDEEARKAAEKRLDDMVKFAETDGCRRVNLLKYFGETYAPKTLDGEPIEGQAPDRCGACDFCVGACPRVDATVDAQKALSAIVRTGGRFGAAHIADLLLGTETEKILRFRHNELPTFGVGKDKSKGYWIYLIQALVTQGIAELDPTFEFPIPQISLLGWEVLRGAKKVQIIERPDSAKSKARSKAIDSATKSKDLLKPLDRKLFEKLRALRAMIAKAENVPPYIIFSDKTLVDMAILKPRSDAEFLDVAGIGRRKLENYGEEFIDAIVEFLDTET